MSSAETVRSKRLLNFQRLRLRLPRIAHRVFSRSRPLDHSPARPVPPSDSGESVPHTQLSPTSDVSQLPSALDSLQIGSGDHPQLPLHATSQDEPPAGRPTTSSNTPNHADAAPRAAAYESDMDVDAEASEDLRELPDELKAMQDTDDILNQVPSAAFPSTSPSPGQLPEASSTLPRYPHFDDTSTPSHPPLALQSTGPHVQNEPPHLAAIRSWETGLQGQRQLPTIPAAPPAPLSPEVQHSDMLTDEQRYWINDDDDRYSYSYSETSGGDVPLSAPEVQRSDMLTDEERFWINDNGSGYSDSGSETSDGYGDVPSSPKMKMREEPARTEDTSHGKAMAYLTQFTKTAERLAESLRMYGFPENVIKAQLQEMWTELLPPSLSHSLPAAPPDSTSSPMPATSVAYDTQPSTGPSQSPASGIPQDDRPIHTSYDHTPAFPSSSSYAYAPPSQSPIAGPSSSRY